MDPTPQQDPAAPQAPDRPAPPRVSERFVITGAVEAADFPGWIGAHGRKLGLELGPMERQGAALAFRAAGAPEMLDALEMGCSLGPRSVTVQRVDRQALSNEGPAVGFNSAR
ncbi:acylphosphatase [Mesobaculum littorinae]|uniref:Acylphosphatase n=1 Tax=Mesobaculum littorinae TaxID=2486419 RepID=A0A438AJF9_9RHOB|nr:acylphosphatase [Mesobaculum littorinae]RVV98921.1 acylphosphatase [Mesobaculum littorinae]